MFAVFAEIWMAENGPRFVILAFYGESPVLIKVVKHVEDHRKGPYYHETSQSSNETMPAAPPAQAARQARDAPAQQNGSAGVSTVERLVVFLGC
jgi:hypothetical protein